MVNALTIYTIAKFSIYFYLLNKIFETKLISLTNDKEISFRFLINKTRINILKIKNFYITSKNSY